MPPDRRGGAADGGIRVRLVERFPRRRRLRQHSGPLLRARSGVTLLVAALAVGLVLAAALSVVVWAVSLAVHHAAGA